MLGIGKMMSNLVKFSFITFDTEVKLLNELKFHSKEDFQFLGFLQNFLAMDFFDLKCLQEKKKNISYTSQNINTIRTLIDS